MSFKRSTGDDFLWKSNRDFFTPSSCLCSFASSLGGTKVENNKQKNYQNVSNDAVSTTQIMERYNLFQNWSGVGGERLT